MDLIKKIVTFLDPFKQLITIVVFLVGAAYAAITYFATAQQLEDARARLESLQSRQHSEAIAALEELKCLNRLNRLHLRAEMEEFRLTTLLEKNLSKSELLRDKDDHFARVELASLEANRDTITARIRELGGEKQGVLVQLQDGSCSSST